VLGRWVGSRLVKCVNEIYIVLVVCSRGFDVDKPDFSFYCFQEAMDAHYPSILDIGEVRLSVCEDGGQSASFKLDPSDVDTNLFFADVCLVESVAKQEREAILSLEEV
jgi:hypothetical protein